MGLLGGAGGRNKTIIINCSSAECYDLWSQSGASRGVTLDFQRHLSCGFGRFAVTRVQMFASRS